NSTPLTITAVTVCGATTTGIVTNNGDVVITTDELEIAAPVSAGAGCVTIRQLTVARAIDLGTEAAGSLSLKDSELDFITAGAGLTIGDAAGGAVTVSAPITAPAGYTRLALRSAGTV